VTGDFLVLGFCGWGGSERERGLERGARRGRWVVGSYGRGNGFFGWLDRLAGLCLGLLVGCWVGFWLLE